MQNKIINIREVSSNDCESVFEWRNDKHSREMFFDDKVSTYEEHLKWFHNSLINKNRKIYIGEINGKRIGICRFDYDELNLDVEVSININPLFRGKGIGKLFLSKSIDVYLTYNEFNLKASIKKQNYASIKIFEFVGFKMKFEVDDVVFFHKPIEFINIREVDDDDAVVLFELLKDRVHSISHEKLPSFDEHKKFVKRKPYEYWFLVYRSNSVIGSFYVQKNNSIGLNLLSPNKKVVSSIIDYINNNLSPNPEVKSKIPSYFYINISYSNHVLQDIVFDLNCLPIQTSFKLKRK